MTEDSLRKQYERYGARGYYEQFGAQYRNPHEWAVRSAIHAAVAAWGLDLSRVLDLACGSGEATLALRDDPCPDLAYTGPNGGAGAGAKSSRASAGLATTLAPDAIWPTPAPTAEPVRVPNRAGVLPRSCQARSNIEDRYRGATTIEGVDPYTGAAYQARTGLTAEALSFEAIAGGALDGRRYSLVVCSYALHLLAPSRLPRLAYQLSRIAGALLVLTPHKRPHLRPEWGWRLAGEMVVDRVRARSYQSTDE